MTTQIADGTNGFGKDLEFAGSFYHLIQP
jgi:hypothetical protein